MIRVLLRIAAAEVGYAAVNVSYWIRPYDQIADARRWRWQRRATCGSQWWSQLSDDDKAVMVAAVMRAARRKEAEK